MATDPEKTIVPPSQTRGVTAPDAVEVARKGGWARHAANGVEPSVRDAAMNATQVVRDYHASKAA